MKSAFVVVAVLTLSVGSESAPTKEDQAKAKQLLAAGLEKFRNGDYQNAYTDFDRSYALDKQEATAILAADAIANADHSHPSRALIWIQRWRELTPKPPQNLEHALGAMLGNETALESNFQTCSNDLTSCRAQPHGSCPKITFDSTKAMLQNAKLELENVPACRKALAYINEAYAALPDPKKFDQ